MVEQVDGSKHTIITLPISPPFLIFLMVCLVLFITLIVTEPFIPLPISVTNARVDVINLSAFKRHEFIVPFPILINDYHRINSPVVFLF